MQTRLRAIWAGILAALLALVPSFKLFDWAFISYWEWQHQGRKMKFTIWADERAFVLALFLSGFVFFVTLRYFQGHIAADHQVIDQSLAIHRVRAMTTQRLYRLAAIVEWGLALLVSIPCAAMLHSIRTGQFHNSNWVDPRSWAKTMELGLGLSAACVLAGVGLWTMPRTARWFEAVLAVPKLYCAAIALFLLAVTHNWLFLCIIIGIITSLGMGVSLWLPRSRAREQTVHC